MGFTNWQDRAEKAEDVLRSLASFVGAGGYNADKVDADVFEQKIRWGIGQIMERLEKAEAELARLREQKPAGYVLGDWRGATTISAVKSSHFNTPLYAESIPVPAVAAPAVPDDRVSQDDAALMQAASALALYRAGESAEYMAKAIEAMLQSAPTGEQK